MAELTLTKEDKTKILQEIEFGPIEGGDLEQLSGLISSMRPYSTDQVRVRDFSPDYFHWMYFRNPAGAAYTCCAKHRDKLVCSFAMAPKRVWFKDRVVMVGKTMEMFTHPEYQGMRLMSRTAGEVYQAARASGIDMWYVTPSANSYPIFTKKWGCVEAFTNNYVINVLRPSIMLSRVIRPGVLGWLAGLPMEFLLGLTRFFRFLPSGYGLEAKQSFGPEADALWERSKGRGIALVRDAEYLNWRYVDNPDRYLLFLCHGKGGEPAGILVLKHTLRRGRKVGEIVDFLCPPEDVVTRRAMFLLAIERLLRDGCIFAQAWAIEGTALERELRSAGISLRRKKLPILLSPEAPEEEFYNPQAWFLTQGDGNDL
ncbi:MAG: hypothetical protein ACYTG7_15405 [Planctomycetota bacterium]|jgi:GNAT superfamily N-acetyltransferase